MDFSLNEMQEMMKDSAARFVQQDYDFEGRRELIKTELGYSAKNWSLFAELGWLALPIQEAYGGLDGSVIDVMVLQQELGKGLVVEPFVSTIVLGGSLVQAQGSEEQKQSILPNVLSGEMKLAVAFAEPGALFDITQITTNAKAEGNGFVINGTKATVLGAANADRLLVVARTTGGAGDKKGISVFCVDPSAEGVSVSSYPTNDGHRAADVMLQNVLVSADQVLGSIDSAHDTVAKVLNEVAIVLAAEAVGIMEKLLHDTVEYLKTREQFGTAIGNFQVLQHRAADMFIECEQAKSMLYFAALQQDKPLVEATRAVSMLKVKVGNSGRLVGQQAVQLHGGMGICDELNIGHFFKRLTCINTFLGSRDSHLQRLIDNAA